MRSDSRGTSVKLLSVFRAQALWGALLGVLLGGWLSLGAQPGAAMEQLVYRPLDSLEGVLDSELVLFDAAQSFDGRGSLRIEAKGPLTVRLFETGDLDVENARLLYQAALRSKNLEGHAYLEMWCVFPGLGEYFSRALHAPIGGSTDWVQQETPFFLKPGENPQNVRLNLVVTGPGTIWIDDLRLLRQPL